MSATPNATGRMISRRRVVFHCLLGSEEGVAAAGTDVGVVVGACGIDVSIIIVPVKKSSVAADGGVDIVAETNVVTAGDAACRLSKGTKSTAKGDVSASSEQPVSEVPSWQVAAARIAAGSKSTE